MMSHSEKHIIITNTSERNRKKVPNIITGDNKQTVAPSIVTRTNHMNREVHSV